MNAPPFVHIFKRDHPETDRVHGHWPDVRHRRGP
jgi:hypothetical protein